MKSIKILVIGTHDWIDGLSNELAKMEESFTIERIEDEGAAVKRLAHNSYNILLIQDGFSKIDSIRLASLAYAMTRPSVILCRSRLRYIRYKAWRFFSKFSRKFKTSRVLINFSYGMEGLEEQVVSLANGYLDYFDQVNAEIRENTLNRIGLGN